MSIRNKDPSSSPPRATPDGEAGAVAERLDEELRAMGSLLRADLDERLRGLEMGAGLAPTRGASAAERFWHGFMRHRHDVFAAFLLAGLLFLGWQVRALRLQAAGAAISTEASTEGVRPAPPVTVPGQGPATAPPTAPSPDAVAGTPAEGNSGTTSLPPAALPINLDDPVASWRAYLNDHPDRVPGWATAVATYQGFGAADMSPGQRTRFEGFAATPANAIQNADLCLKGLFELAMRMMLEQDPGGTIDLDLREYDAAAVSAVAASLGLGADTLPTHDASAARVQAAIAVAWLERRARQE